MLAAGIILPVQNTTWVSNPVIVRKKSGEIRICIDFRNLNQASLKDNYPFPNMENLLQSVTSAGILVNVRWFLRIQSSKDKKGR